MNYERNFVLCAFRALHPDPLEPADDRIAKFDEELRKTLDDAVKAAAADNGIDTTDGFNLSILIFFAACSTAKLPQTRARHACVFFNTVKPVP